MTRGTDTDIATRLRVLESRPATVMAILEVVRSTGSIALAATVLGCSARTLFRILKRDTELAKAVRQIQKRRA